MELSKSYILLMLFLILVSQFLTVLAIFPLSNNENYIAFPLQNICHETFPCAKGIMFVNPNMRTRFSLDTSTIEPTTVGFSPDGQTLTYFSNGALHLVNMQTLEEFSQIPVNSYSWSYSWSSASNTIALIGIENSTSLPNLYLLDVDTWDYEQVTDDLNIAPQTVSWSPDDSHLLFSAHHNQNGSGIYMLDITTREITNITNSAGLSYSPDWSSDGSRFVYVAGDERPERLIIRDETTVFQSIEIDADMFGTPEWVLNDEYIVLFINQNGGSVLHIVDVETGTVSLLGERDGVSGYDISADGTQIVYLTDLSSRLCVFDLVTSETQCLPNETPFSWAVPVWNRS